MNSITEEMIEAACEAHWDTWRKNFHDDLTKKRMREMMRKTLTAALSAGEAVQPVAVKPFMYGIMEPDGTACMDELCVDLDRGTLEELVEEGEMSGYTVVPLFLHPAPASAGVVGEWQPTYNDIDAAAHEWLRERAPAERGDLSMIQAFKNGVSWRAAAPQPKQEGE